MTGSESQQAAQRACFLTLVIHQFCVFPEHGIVVRANGMLQQVDRLRIEQVKFALAFPLIESFARFCIFLLVYRRDVIGRAIDLVRMSEFVLISLLMILVGLTVREVIGVASDLAALAIAGGCVAAMMGAILLLRPIRPDERDVVLSMIPKSWSWPRDLVMWLTR